MIVTTIMLDKRYLDEKFKHEGVKSSKLTNIEMWPIPPIPEIKTNRCWKSNKNISEELKKLVAARELEIKTSGEDKDE